MPAVTDLAGGARYVGAADVLVLRRVGRTRWAHLGGLGRGESWAGTVEADSATDVRLGRALAADRPVREHGPAPHHVLGPYWATTSALVRVDDDHAVVLGSPLGSTALRDASDDALRAAARVATAAVSAVSPAKFLADELEVLSAVRDLACGVPATVSDVMQHVARTAAVALSCELAALWLPRGRFVVVQRGWSLPGSADELSRVVRSMSTQVDEPVVVQDATERPLAHPVGPADGAVSYLALPVDTETGRGVLLLVHTAATTRGFTDLCQRLGAQLAETAGLLLAGALTREELQRALDSSRQHASRDPLTGAANRRGWDEAIARVRPLVAGGSAVTVVTVDVDGLKVVNDSLGHAGGDELIVACARALRHTIRGERDVVARLGGDEFGLIMPGVQTAPAVITRRLRRSLDAMVTPSGLRLRTSIGAATCAPFASLDEAVRRADAAMYADKRSRRRTA